MRVLITGATGFVGQGVLPLLGEHDVLCLARDPARLPIARPGLRAIAGDLGKSGDWQDAVASFRPEWCFHLAWDGLPDYSLDRCRVNMDGSLRLLDVLAKSGVKRVIGAGSCFEYGSVAGAVSEDTTPVGLGMFAATKRALLTMLETVSQQAAFDYRWARIFFVYGPRQRPTSLIPHLHAAAVAGRPPALREPAAMQDFIHVEDVAAGLVALAQYDAPSGVFNLGTGEPVSVAYVANRVAEYHGQPRPFGHLPAGQGQWADTGKTFALTGWRARIGIDEGIARTLAAFTGRQ